MFGNRLNIILYGSYSMQKELSDKFKIFIKFPVIEWLYITELKGSAFATNLHNLNNFRNGSVIGIAKIFIKSVPDLRYSIDKEINEVNCPEGEIVQKAPLIYEGYYKNNKENTKGFDKVGYFHIVDIGRFFPNLGNRLKIFDGIKKKFKLAQAE